MGVLWYILMKPYSSVILFCFYVWIIWWHWINRCRYVNGRWTIHKTGRVCLHLLISLEQRYYQVATSLDPVKEVDLFSTLLIILILRYKAFTRLYILVILFYFICFLFHKKPNSWVWNWSVSSVSPLQFLFFPHFNLHFFLCKFFFKIMLNKLSLNFL